MVKQIKLILLVAYSVMAAFLLSAISSCCPGTAGYDWHSGESEVIPTSSQIQESAASSRETNFSNSIG
ncbi:MAG: hypothetical protein ACN4GW_16235, partial [Desulforhopalus sp.]